VLVTLAHKTERVPFSERFQVHYMIYLTPYSIISYKAVEK